MFSLKSARVPYPEDLELGQDITVMIGPYDFTYNVVKTEFFSKANRYGFKSRNDISSLLYPEYPGVNSPGR